MQDGNSLVCDDVAEVTVVSGAAVHPNIHPYLVLHIHTLLLHLVLISSVHLLLHLRAPPGAGLGGPTLDVLQSGGFRASRELWDTYLVQVGQ